MEQMTDAMAGPLDLNPGANRGPQIDSILSQLAALFQRTEADLSYVSRKLQTEFSSAYSAVGAQTVRAARGNRQGRQLAAMGVMQQRRNCLRLAHDPQHHGI